MEFLESYYLLDQVRRTPSVTAWEHLLNTAITTSMEEAFDRLGGISSLVRSVIDDSADPVAARQIMTEAVDRIAEAWQPATPSPFSEVERTLRLLASTTRFLGFTKILGHLSRHGSFRTTDEQPDRYPDNYLTLLGLTALGRFFPSPIPDASSSDAYMAYKRLLYTLVDRQGLRGHACARLLELESEALSGPLIDKQIQLHPQDTVPTFLAWLLNTSRNDIGVLVYHLYLSAQSNSRLKPALDRGLAAQRASIDDSDGAPYLVLRNGIAIRLGDSDEYLDSVGRGWNEEATQGDYVVSQAIGGKIGID